MPRAEHTISRQQIDPDALKVLYRLHQNGLHRLPGRRQRPRPAARPQAQGLRHRHLGASVPGQEAVPELLDHRPPLPAGARPLRHQDDRGGDLPAAGVGRGTRPPPKRDRCSRRRRRMSDAPTQSATTSRDRLVHRDNTFGTPEEDAFRRDFTINALFYDIATFSIIDYTGGLEDLRDGRRPLHRRSRRALPGGPGADAARRRDGGAPRLHHRPADRRAPSRRIAARSRAARRRG